MTNSAASQAAEETPAIIVLLRRQLDLFEQLGELSEQQSRVVHEGPADALLTLLAARQRQIEQLTVISAELEPYRADWASTRAELTPVQQARVDELIATTQGRLDAIIRQDDRDREQLKQMQQKIGGELTKLTHAGTAVRAYQAPASGSTNIFTNRQG